MFDFADKTISREDRRRKFWIRRVVLALSIALLFGGTGGLAAFALESGPEEITARQTGNAASDGGSGQSTDATEATTLASTEEPTEPETTSEPMNVLVLGVDKRPEDETAEAMGVRADTIMVARLDPNTGKTSLLSLPRDLFLEIAPGEEDRINASYAEGGVDQTLAVVEHYTDLQIDHYAVIDFAGFEDLINAMGGVDVKIVDGYYPPGMHLTPCTTQELDGEAALRYSRYRGSAGGDFDRIKRQQGVVNALKSEALSWDSVVRLPAMAKVVYENTDSDLGLLEALPIARAAISEARKSSGGIHTFRLDGEPTVLDDGRQVLMPKDEENMQVIADFTSAQTGAPDGDNGSREDDSGNDTCSVS